MAIRRIDAPSQVWIGGSDHSGDVLAVFVNEQPAAAWAADDEKRWVIGPLTVIGAKRRGREAPKRYELVFEPFDAPPLPDIVEDFGF